MDLTSLSDDTAECAVLAEAMKSPEAFFEVSSAISAEGFTNQLYSKLWAEMGSLMKANQKFNVLELAKSVDGSRYTAQDVMKIYTTGQLSGVPIRDCVVRLNDLLARRNIISQCYEISSKAFDIDRSPTDVASNGAISLARAVKVTSAGVTKHEAMEAVVRHLSSTVPCFSTGLPGMDELLGGGLYSNKLYALAARKKVGKTIILGTISANLNAMNVPHLFIALEMTPMEIETRQVARSLNVAPIRLIRGQSAQFPVDPHDAVDLVPKTPNATFYEGRPGATLDEVERMIFTAVQHHKIKGVMLDYWQLVQGKASKESEEWHLRVVAQRLADLSRRLGIWIIVACQLNQEGNSRGGEGIKLACDAYMVLHREKSTNGAWVDLEECRYTGYGSLGTEAIPGLWLEENGPYFREC